VLLLCSVQFTGAAEPEDQRFEFSSYHEVDALFEKLNYTPAAWRAGIREVPRVYLDRIPPRWRDETSKEITVQSKKRLFFRGLAPFVLRSNELIVVERERLEKLAPTIRAGKPVGEADRSWLGELAVRYGVIETADSAIDGAVLDELWVRVDVIPVSLALSQAAEESGWGTSRFAIQRNALFGMWTWGGKGIKPEQQRKELGEYRIASFETPLDGIRAYMRNLNTHRAYAKLRERRAEMRGKSEPIQGWALAETLDKYSERGQAYVESLHAIMRVNKLGPADDAYLGDGPVIRLIPVGEGS
jgi:Bax protein